MYVNNILRTLTYSAGIVGLTIGLSAARAADIDSIHFLIPGGPGGGWDSTARGVGEALTKSGLVGSASFENMSGGGGGKAIAYLIKTARKQQRTLMVNSTPIIIRSLQKVFPQSFRDLTPVAGVIGDYAVLVVRKNSSLGTFGDLVKAYKANPNKIAIGGGSVTGGMDHLVAAMIMKGAGTDPTKIKYVPYDAGGKAMAGLLSGEVQVLSTGFSEAIDMARQDQVRFLCVTSKTRLADAKNIPTCIEAGAKGAEFVNWRGLFGPPGLSNDRKQAYVAVLKKMYKTPQWETVRARNGWINIFNADADFVKFLKTQESVIGNLMKELGFL
jgi:putative tricarboxylic transport membrane protein